MQKFIGHCGMSMSNNNSFYFSDYFDWIIMNDIIIKKQENPRHVYIKIDYLKKYINEIISIKNDFILISGCSDYSPQINFTKEYLIIINLPNLKKWYSENNLSIHPKMYSLTVGFATHSKEYEDNLLLIRKNINIKDKLNKIFCCWRPRNNNCCGNKYNERKDIIDFIYKYPDIFDIVDIKNNELNTIEFHEKLLTYKWCLCPLGNGVDCAPKILECFFLKTIPIMCKNINLLNLYKNFPVIWVDNFSDILYMKLQYDELINWDNIIEQFTCDFWYKKIIE